jgi:AcrR family transcriptional regulator
MTHAHAAPPRRFQQKFRGSAAKLFGNRHFCGALWLNGGHTMTFVRAEDDAQTRAVRERLLVRALEEFGEHGLQAARVERIARLARVSTATLYRLYPGKEELFAAALRHGLDTQAAWQTPAADDPLVELVLAARAYAEALETSAVRKLARILFGELRPRSPALMALGRETRSILEGKFARPLARCAEAGLLDLTMPNSVEALLLGMIEHQCLLHGLLMGDDDQAAFCGDAVADEAVCALIARHGGQGVRFPEEALRRHARVAA